MKQVALTSQRLQICKPVEMNMRNCYVKWFYTSDKGKKIKHRKEVDFNRRATDTFFQYRKKLLYLLFIPVIPS